MAYFYDTCALLNKQEALFDGEVFYLSIISLQELENIKTSFSKDEETKWKARKLLRLLDANEGKYQVVLYDNSWDDEILKDKLIPKLFLLLMTYHASFYLKNII